MRAREALPSAGGKQPISNHVDRFRGKRARLACGADAVLLAKAEDRRDRRSIENSGCGATIVTELEEFLLQDEGVGMGTGSGEAPQRGGRATRIKLREGGRDLVTHGSPPGLSRGNLQALERSARLVARSPLSQDAAQGSFVAPVAFELPLADLPRREVFGPVLHVARYAPAELERALAAVAQTRYGLTLGIHSRIDAFVRRVREQLPAGNTYVNRNMIGAVVGVQPFGGEGLSGTGPKAGGPRYLHRFAVERTLTVNTAAVGGNADLLAGGE